MERHLRTGGLPSVPAAARSLEYDGRIMEDGYGNHKGGAPSATISGKDFTFKGNSRIIKNLSFFAPTKEVRIYSP